MSGKNTKMGLTSHDRKKDKSNLPPSGRSWPFKRSKSKGKEAGEAAIATEASSDERKGNCDSDYPSGPASPTKSSSYSSDSQDGKGENDAQVSNLLRGDSREDLVEPFSALTERERILFHDLQEVSLVSYNILTISISVHLSSQLI